MRTTHERVKYVQRTCGMVDMVLADDFGTQHRDLQSYRISKSENSVKRTMDPVNCFTNLFAADASRPSMLASGATEESVEDDVLNADKTGSDQKEKFIQERLQTH